MAISRMLRIELFEPTDFVVCSVVVEVPAVGFMVVTVVVALVVDVVLKEDAVVEAPVVDCA